MPELLETLELMAVETEAVEAVEFNQVLLTAGLVEMVARREVAVVEEAWETPTQTLLA